MSSTTTNANAVVSSTETQQRERPTFVKKMSTIIEEETTEVVVEEETTEGQEGNSENASGRASASASTLTERTNPSVPCIKKLVKKRTLTRIDEIEEVAEAPEDADGTLNVEQKRKRTTIFQEATYGPAPTYTETVGVAEYRGTVLVPLKRKREEGQGGKPWYRRLFGPVTPASWWASKEKRQLELCDADHEDKRAAKRLKVAPSAPSSSSTSDCQGDRQGEKDDTAHVNEYFGWINFYIEDGVQKGEDDNELVNRALGFFCNELKRD